MNPIVKNILAVITGLVLGSAVNMSLVMLSGTIIPPPEGADVTDMESLKTSMHLFETKQYIFPFLAHALFTVVGAIIVAIIAQNHKMKLATLIGIFFFLGGSSNLFMLPSPLWFSVLDLAVAYIPMSWLGWKIAQLRTK